MIYTTESLEANPALRRDQIYGAKYVFNHPAIQAEKPRDQLNTWTTNNGSVKHSQYDEVVDGSSENVNLISEESYIYPGSRTPRNIPTDRNARLFLASLTAKKLKRVLRSSDYLSNFQRNHNYQNLMLN
jgi:hypothetical protein